MAQSWPFYKDNFMKQVLGMFCFQAMELQFYQPDVTRTHSRSHFLSIFRHPTKTMLAMCAIS